MPKFEVTAVTLDGTKQTATGEMAPLRDRIAFEHHFGLSAIILRDLDGDHPDPNVLREEWVAFLVYRMLRTADQIPAGQTFEAWLETIQDELEVTALDVGLDPTNDPAPGESLPSSPSTGG